MAGWAAFAQGMSEAAGDLWQNYWQKSSAKYGRKQQQRMFDFQREMSDTAVQRRMADLDAAGINPLLAGRWEASTPPGGTGGGPQVPSSNAGKANYLQLGLMAAQRNKLNAETKLLGTREETQQAFAEISTAIADLLRGLKGDTDIEGQTQKNLQWLYDFFDPSGANKTNQIRGAAQNLQPFLGQGGNAAINSRVPTTAYSADQQRRSIAEAEQKVRRLESQLQLYKNEDVNSKQIEKLLRQARFELEMMKEPRR